MDKENQVGQNSGNEDKNAASESHNQGQPDQEKTNKKLECEICRKLFSHPQHLRSHMIFLHDEGKDHCCKVCGENFKQKYHLNEHMKEHENLKQYKCEKCGKRFVTKYGMHIHLQCHSGKKYSCPTCDKTCINISSLRGHRKLCTKERKFSCEICWRKFYYLYLLKYHESFCKGHFECSLCNKKDFTSKGQLKQHEKIHTGDLDIFSCTVCSKFFSKASHLKTHMRIHDPSIDKSNSKKKAEMFSCDICSDTFSSKSSLDKHGVIHTQEKPFACTLCDKRFCRRTSLWSHKTIKHSSVAKFKCTICSQKFRIKSKFYEHMKRHESDKPFKCNECHKSFSTTSALSCHKKCKHVVDKKVKVHICDFCGKRCSCPSIRLQHMRKHTGELPYRCDICGKSFPSANSRNNHTRRHTLPYECGICNVRFVEKKTLVEHIKNHEMTVNNNESVGNNGQKQHEYDEMENGINSVIENNLTTSKTCTVSKHIVGNDEQVNNFHDQSCNGTNQEAVPKIESLDTVHLEREMISEQDYLIDNTNIGNLNEDSRNSTNEYYSESNTGSIKSCDVSKTVKTEFEQETYGHASSTISDLKGSPLKTEFTNPCSSNLGNILPSTNISQTIDKKIVLNKVGTFRLKTEDLNRILKGQSLLNVINTDFTCQNTKKDQ